MLSQPQSPRTLTRGPRVSPFGGILINSPPTSPGNLPTRDNFPLKTRNLPSLTSVQVAEYKVLPTEKKTFKGLRSPAPSTKNRTDSLGGGGWGGGGGGGGGGGERELAHYQARWIELFPPFPEIIWKISQDILIAFSDDAPTLLHRPLELHSNNKPLDLLQAVKKAPGLPSHRRSEGHLVTGLLQSPLSVSQTKRIFPSNHRSQEVKSVSGHTFFQNGNFFLHHPSSTTTRMDYQDKTQRCLSSYPSPCEHLQVLSLCCSWKDLSVLCTPVWSLDGTPRVYQDLSTCCSTASYPRDKSSCIPRRLDHPSRFTWTESPTYPTNHPTSTNFGMDYQLERSKLEPSHILDFFGQHFNLERDIVSPLDSFLDSLTSVLSRLSTSTVMPAWKISSITSQILHFARVIHHGRLLLRFLQFWIKRHWSQHKQSWDTPVQLDAEFLTQLHCINRWEVLKGLPLHLPEPNLFFFTDAYLTGWGAR